MSPYAAGRPCPGVGPRRGSCPNLIRGSERNCEICDPYVKAKNKRYDKARGNSGERGYDAAWAKIRNVKASQDPLCEFCLRDGLVVPLDVVHHDKPIETHPELRLVMDNLISLCNEHHEIIHGPERWGK